ncbi:MAG: hypothetical protein HYY61_04290 [Deltaproteobacteria bacterium]|nr:hypothetical protein [Deltaproteobacteria bacterium]
MVFQKWLSILLTGTILTAPFHSAFSQESNDPAILKVPQESRAILRKFNQLKEDVQNLFKAGEQEKATEAFCALKNFTEKVLNTPLLNWDSVSLEFTISQLEDALIKDVQGFEPIANEERIFWDRALADSESPTLIEKEKIFLGFEEIRKEFDKMRMVFHWNATPPSYLKLKEQGKKDFERFVSQPRYHIRQIDSDQDFEIVPKLSDLQALELEVLAQDRSESGWNFASPKTSDVFSSFVLPKSVSNTSSFNPSSSFG